VRKRKKTRNPSGFCGVEEVAKTINPRSQEELRVKTNVPQARLGRKRRKQTARARRKRQQQLQARKRRIERRLAHRQRSTGDRPVFGACAMRYELGERAGGIAWGGIGAMHALARQIGLIDAIDRNLHILRMHQPYHESDHVLNFAYNALCDGTCLQDLELRRNDEGFLDALEAARIPDPTTAGDFCRRFTAEHLETLQNIFDDVRVGVWAKQPAEFFTQAIIEGDGTMVATTGECKQGMDISYKGVWGYHPLVLTLANTGEVLRVVNRSGNRPSHEGAAAQFDQAMATCFRGGFDRVLLRGDTDFSQTQYLDRWDDDGRVHFHFGYDARANLEQRASAVPAENWQPLQRPPRYQVQTRPRERPDKVKERIVRERAFETLRLQSEEVAEFDYRPSACRKSYRMIVVRKNISREKGERRLFDEIRYFFYITNDRDSTAAEVVFSANDRCNQENLLAQLHSGVRALQAPVDTLLSNGAYMVMTALAWNLKAWWALTLPETGRWHERHRAQKHWVLKIEFKTFLNAFIKLPCQIVRRGRQLVYRLLSWNPYLSIFFRLTDELRC
jgi:Transposase DDE domain group 1